MAIAALALAAAGCGDVPAPEADAAEEPDDAAATDAPVTDAPPAVDAPCEATFFADVDGDGFGDPDDSVVACTAPEDYVEDDTDCDDDNPDVHPDATETCNGNDDDCSGVADEPPPADAPTWYADTDIDGFGDPDVSVQACEQPDGYVDDSRDCYDESEFAKPTQTSYFANHRGDGSHDYNCDGNEELRYPDMWGTFTCSFFGTCSRAGWVPPTSAPPDCGVPGELRTCGIVLNPDGTQECFTSESTKIQGCR